jgi:hypothetical protein
VAGDPKGLLTVAGCAGADGAPNGEDTVAGAAGAEPDTKGDPGADGATEAVPVKGAARGGATGASAGVACDRVGSGCRASLSESGSNFTASV